MSGKQHANNINTNTNNNNILLKKNISEGPIDKLQQQIADVTPQEMQHEVIDEIPQENTDATMEEARSKIPQELNEDISSLLTHPRIVPNETIKEEVAALPYKVPLDINKVANKVMDEILESPIIQMHENVIRESPQNLLGFHVEQVTHKELDETNDKKNY